ncbi:MAG: flagellar export chaperone FliS [Gammaproteobacteria bacterium]|nr:flagellar export chaperone FliS [Gammaproteobacteria bacterium]
MNTTNFNNAVKQYSQVGVTSGVEQASPHRLIQMLMGGAIDRIAIAKGAMERKDTANKGANISWAISIVDGLRASLDKNAGGEIAQNLDDLYDYMIRRLMRANMEDNPDLLDEVLSLLRSIKSAWDSLPKQLHATAG